ncbi:hypothetical protein [Paenibacillus apiarius]|uniref:hypothetical protein n=1 Tax=Paenibacillus apiarius TaxID=46240 RepID=UPI003B3AD579
MKTISKKIATGTMIAAFVLGVGAVNNYALAESASDATGSTSIQQSSPERNELGGKGRGGFGDKIWRHGNMIKTTATVLNVDEASITASLKEGKTLAEIAEANGLSKEDYLQIIIAAETESINAEVTGGKVTQEQADKILSSLSERLTKQIEGTGLAGVHEGKRVGHGGMGFGNPEVLTQILGITQDDLRTEMEAGKSILDVATAKGISEDDLIGKIKDGMTDTIKKFVESKGGFQHKHPEGEASADETDSAAN